MEDNELLDFLFQILKKYNVGDRVIIELLEDEAIQNFDVVLHFIKSVKKLGIKIAIDDYGSGYSNLERIFQFEPDFLKIDGSIIKGIVNDPTKLAIAKSAVFLAKELQIETVAEFVSDEEIFNICKNIGIDYLQGYYIEEPKEEI
jgi:EAL domain-containing protein (putative c-di-GMP-specific phosphodiesterase class I)